MTEDATKLVGSAFVEGQRILYKGDVCNARGNGVVINVRQSADHGARLSQFVGGRFIPLDTSVTFDVVLDDGRQIHNVVAGQVGGTASDHSLRFMLLADREQADAQEIAALLSNAACIQAQKQAKLEAERQAFQEAIVLARTQGVALGLIPVDEFTKAGKRGSPAAHNLRLQIKGLGITKCSVKQRSFNAIDVYLPKQFWAKHAKEVEALALRYESGHFDSMSDSYKYEKNPWGSVFGEVRYIFVYQDSA